MAERQTTVARRYAHALFNSAQRIGALDAVAGEVKGLRDLDARDARLRLFLESPQVRDDHKHAVVDTVLGGRVSQLVTEFLHLLLRKKRFPELPTIARELEALVEEARGLVRAQVTTAVTLSEREKDALVRELEALSGKKIVLQPRVDPAVLGGVVVKLGDRILDRSIRTLLDQLKEDLLAVRV